MSFPSKRRIALLVLAGILILSLGVMITMYVEVPAGQSHVEQVITSAALLRDTDEIVTGTSTPSSSVAVSVTPTSENGNFDRPIPHPCPSIKKVGIDSERFSAYWTELVGSGPYPDCDKPVGWLVVVKYQKNGVTYDFNMNDDWLYWITITNYKGSRS